MGDPQPRVAAWIAAAPSADVDRRAIALPLARAAQAGRSAVLLETCHRVELYAGGAADVDGDALAAAGMERLDGVAAVRRIVDVAVGLESAVLGEDQLLHQLRGAVTAARRTGALDRDLDRTLDQALRAGRIARSWRPVGLDGPGRSLADRVAADVVRRLGPSAGRRVLVVGAGAMGEAVVVALRRAALDVAIASPTGAHAAEVGGRHGIETWPWDPGARLADVAVVVIALAGPWTLPLDRLEVLRGRSLVIDLSMPPALPADLAVAMAERHVGIDQLAVVADPSSPAVERYRARLGALAERTAAAVVEELGDAGRSGAAALAERVERQRREAVAAYLRGRPGLDPAARDAIEAATRVIAACLFRAPLERLADDPRGARRRAAEELFGR